MRAVMLARPEYYWKLYKPERSNDIELEFDIDESILVGEDVVIKVSMNTL